MSPPDIPGVVRVASSHEIEDATATLLSMAGADFSTPPPERTGSAVAAADRPRPRCAGTADHARPPPATQLSGLMPVQALILRVRVWR